MNRAMQSSLNLEFLVKQTYFYVLFWCPIGWLRIFKYSQICGKPLILTIPDLLSLRQNQVQRIVMPSLVKVCFPRVEPAQNFFLVGVIAEFAVCLPRTVKAIEPQNPWSLFDLPETLYDGVFLAPDHEFESFKYLAFFSSFAE